MVVVGFSRSCKGSIQSSFKACSAPFETCKGVIVLPFCGLYLRSYKVIPTRNYNGACMGKIYSKIFRSRPVFSLRGQILGWGALLMHSLERP